MPVVLQYLLAAATMAVLGIVAALVYLAITMHPRKDGASEEGARGER